MTAYNCYLENVQKSIRRNLKHSVPFTTKEVFLNQVIDYCKKLRDDPAEPIIKRKRIRNGKRYRTKEVIR